MHNMKSSSSLYLSLLSDLPRNACPASKYALYEQAGSPVKDRSKITLAVDAIHRHDAHAVVYVLEGEVEMQVADMLQRLSRAGFRIT